MTGNIQNKLANRLKLNNSSGNIKVSQRFKRRNDSLGILKTDKNSSYENKRSQRMTATRVPRFEANMNFLRQSEGKTSRSLLHAQNQTNNLANQLKVHYNIHEEKIKNIGATMYSGLNDSGILGKEITNYYNKISKPDLNNFNAVYARSPVMDKHKRKTVKQKYKLSRNDKKLLKKLSNNKPKYVSENAKPSKIRNKKVRHSRSKSIIGMQVDLAQTSALKKFKKKYGINY
mmetsp:Transcript_21547/g.19118  ORF Transcript_21547/g.19118 Transcript_21547/m.19118 type:complete len:231 (+) Transcript_21547:724-1416(+)